MLTTVRWPDSSYTLWRGNTFAGPFQPWSSSNNWGNQTLPSATLQARFSEFGYAGAPVTNDMAPGGTVGSLLFTTNGYSLCGNALNISAGISNHVSAGTNFISLGLVTSGAMTMEADAGGILVVSNGFNGSGTVHKTGAGTVKYTGTTQNAFSGSVAVDAGTLQVDGMFTDGSFTVNSGTLSGNGTVSAVTMTGGTASPGDNTGVMLVQGNLAMAPAASLQIEINGPTVGGGGYDQLQVNGTVNLNGATLNVIPGYSASVGTSFLILINDGSDSITGTNSPFTCQKAQSSPPADNPSASPMKPAPETTTSCSPALVAARSNSPASPESPQPYSNSKASAPTTTLMHRPGQYQPRYHHLGQHRHRSIRRLRPFPIQLQQPLRPPRPLLPHLSP